MKLLYDSLWLVPAQTTVTSADANFPIANIYEIEPMVRWKAASYPTPGDPVTITLDFGSAKNPTLLFLNRCNFPTVSIKGGATNVVGDATWEKLAVPLSKDNAQNRKVAISLVSDAGVAFNFRYLFIQAYSSSGFDDSDTVPAIGNVIVGTPVEMPTVVGFDIEITGNKYSFSGDGGRYSERPRGRRRHVIAVTMQDPDTTLDAMPKAWTNAVLFADLGKTYQAWLIMNPGVWREPIKGAYDSQLSTAFSERP